MGVSTLLRRAGYHSFVFCSYLFKLLFSFCFLCFFSGRCLLLVVCVLLCLCIYCLAFYSVVLRYIYGKLMRVPFGVQNPLYERFCFSSWLCLESCLRVLKPNVFMIRFSRLIIYSRFHYVCFRNMLFLAPFLKKVFCDSDFCFAVVVGLGS